MRGENPPLTEADENLIEVFDGVVNPRQLLWTTLSTSFTGVLAFNLASQLFRRIAEPAIAGGFALLVGLLCCVGCAAVSTRFVSPKRVMTQDSLDGLASANTMEEVHMVAGAAQTCRRPHRKPLQRCAARESMPCSRTRSLDKASRWRPHHATTPYEHDSSGPRGPRHGSCRSPVLQRTGRDRRDGRDRNHRSSHHLGHPARCPSRGGACLLPGRRHCQAHDSRHSDNATGHTRGHHGRAPHGRGGSAPETGRAGYRVAKDTGGRLDRFVHRDPRGSGYRFCDHGVLRGHHRCRAMAVPGRRCTHRILLAGQMAGVLALVPFVVVVLAASSLVTAYHGHLSSSFFLGIGTGR